MSYSEKKKSISYGYLRGDRKMGKRKEPKAFGTFESIKTAKEGVAFYKMIGEKPTRRGKKVSIW